MKATQKWRCTSCQALHEKLYDAENCCPPERVWVCGQCAEEHDTHDEAKDCCCALPEGATGVLCLCGAHLWAEDEQASKILGDQVRCPRCREKILAGVPSGDAVRQSFVERGLAIR